MVAIVTLLQDVNTTVLYFLNVSSNLAKIGRGNAKKELLSESEFPKKALSESEFPEKPLSES
jgi:hypothetical protein